MHTKSNFRVLSAIVSIAMVLSIFGGLTLTTSAANEVGYSQGYSVYIGIEGQGTISVGYSNNTKDTDLSIGDLILIPTGEEVTVTANAADGYEFDGFKATAGGSLANANTASTTFTMTGSQAVTLTASFKEIKTEAQTYKLTVNAGSGGTVKITSGVVNGNLYKEGAVVGFEAKPNTGYKVKEWNTTAGTLTVDSKYPTSASLKMPANAATVTVTFESIGGGDKPGGDNGNGGDKPGPGDKEDPEVYELTVRAGTGGRVTPTGGYYTIAAEAGTFIDLTATANSGYRFSRWTTDNNDEGYGFITGWNSNSNMVTSSSYTTTENPTTFIMPAADATVTATFTRVTSGIVSGGGSGGSGGGGGGSRTSTDYTNSNTLTGSTTTVGGTSTNVGSNGVVSASAVQTELTRAISATAGDTAVVTTRNATSITAATLKTLADTAAASGKTAVVRADTLSADGTSVQARLYVEPAKLASLTGDLKLGVFTDATSTTAVKNIFSKYFSNNVGVIHCEQSGTFGARLKIAAKVNLTGLNTDTLVFYSYDRATNTYAQITNPEYTIDSNGYIHFFTELAGDIVIVDGPLTQN